MIKSKVGRWTAGAALCAVIAGLAWSEGGPTALPQLKEWASGLGVAAPSVPLAPKAAPIMKARHEERNHGRGRGRGDRGRRRQIPSGSYLATCRDVWFDGETLFAECQTMRGKWQNAALYDPYGCVGDISNQNGNLTCAR